MATTIQDKGISATSIENNKRKNAISHLVHLINYMCLCGMLCIKETNQEQEETDINKEALDC